MYSFRRLNPVPWAYPRRPLQESRVALVTTAAFYLPDQDPFDRNFKGGDPTYRVIPLSSDVDLRRLQIGHRSSAFDPTGIEADYNLALPVDRFRELERQGAIGKLHEHALSFMGSITAPGRLRRNTAPEAARLLVSQDVDVVFLAPV